MELEESHQRPASQNSHYSSHRSHVKPGNHAHSRPPSHQRRPLRSVNENSTLLRSPGPLESMLKTTTETGDIGIFSIKATPPSVTYHHPPRPRPSFGDAGLLARPHSRGLDDNFVHDDRKALPSYRDTTSEIISLYGSSTQPSNSRSFSPSLDDGRRSYSLTTCSSRQLPSQKSSCTLQSFSSSGGLQRPRSPYPYPTRLKRPGFRPASPAMTDNGGVDYSKMVELDRVSYVCAIETSALFRTGTNLLPSGPAMGPTNRHTTQPIVAHRLFPCGQISAGRRLLCLREPPLARIITDLDHTVPELPTR